MRSGLTVLAIVLSWTFVPALLLAPWVRGGPMLRLAGISFRLADGRRPSRRRCLLRTAVSWSPALFLVLITDPFGIVRRVLPSWKEAPEVTTWLSVTLFAVLVLGSIHSVLRPQRGLADRLVGTVLVPK